MQKKILTIITNPTIVNVILPVCLSLTLFIGAVFFFALPAFEETLMAEKQETVKELTNLVWGLLDGLEERVKNGEIDRNQAQELARQYVGNLRYGPDNKDYFWINDTHPRMVMHPYQPDLNGTDLTRFADQEGNYLFVDSVRAVEAKGQGVIRYKWQWKDNPQRIVPKLSFVKEFKPWEWIIGTGIYTEDVQMRISQLDRNLKTIFSFILFCITLLLCYTIWHSGKREKGKFAAETALKSSEERYGTILKIFEDGYFEVDLQGTMLFCNDAMSKIVGYPKSKLIGMNNRSYMDSDTAEKVYTAFNEIYASGKLHKGLDWKVTRPDGTSKWVEASVTLIRDEKGHPSGFRGVARDITEQKKAAREKEALEKQLRHSQKMESIGTLTGGVAHDFNNILSIILGNTEIGLDDLAEWEPARQNLSEIRNATLRAKDLIQQLLSFSRKAEPLLRPVKLDTALNDTLILLRSAIPSNITIQKNIIPPIGLIMADPTQIHQILLNLCTNAFHAMEEINGHLDITLRNRFVDESDTNHYTGLRPGDHVLLEICDNGTGIEPDVVDRIFDPYFTTKEIGKGTGMGLSVVHGIVKNHGGFIRVESRLNEGTCFQILFPMVDVEYKEDLPSTVDLPHGDETILFVDDEELIVQIAQKQLERLGFQVEAQTSPVEALTIFRTDPDRFDLVITDMTMPQMSGENLVREITSIRPHIPIIICTGYNDKITEAISRKIGASGLLMKPFGIEELAKMIKSAIQKTTAV